MEGTDDGEMVRADNYTNNITTTSESIARPDRGKKRQTEEESGAARVELRRVESEVAEDDEPLAKSQRLQALSSDKAQEEQSLESAT